MYCFSIFCVYRKLKKRFIHRCPLESTNSLRTLEDVSFAGYGGRFCRFDQKCNQTLFNTCIMVAYSRMERNWFIVDGERII